MRIPKSFSTILVTGANGFLGRNLVPLLARRSNTKVYGLGRKEPEFLPPELSLSRMLSPDKYTFVEADIRDAAAVNETIRDIQPEVIVHLAGQSNIRAAVNNPNETYQTNVIGTTNVLNAIAANFRPRNYPGTVLASSIMAYGALKPKELPCREDHSRRRPRDPYAISKSVIIDLGAVSARRYGMPVVTTCCANTYGPGDFNHRLIPDSFRDIFFDRPLTIYRQTADFSREFISLAAVLDAYSLMIAKAKDPALRGQYFNFGTGQPVKVSALVKMMVGLSGKKIGIGYAETGKPVESPVQLISSEKALALGWAGEQTPLEQGLRATWEWYQAYFRRHPAGWGKTE